MRQILPYNLWVGNVGESRDWLALSRHGIEAIVDLAVNEPVNAPPREMVYCRFALTDGAGNPRWRVDAAIACVAQFVRDETPVLVHCSAGMSRAPSVAAGGISRATGRDVRECLALVASFGGVDVTPSMWGAVLGVVEG